MTRRRLAPTRGESHLRLHVLRRRSLPPTPTSSAVRAHVSPITSQAIGRKTGFDILFSLRRYSRRLRGCRKRDVTASWFPQRRVFTCRVSQNRQHKAWYFTRPLQADMYRDISVDFADSTCHNTCNLCTRRFLRLNCFYLTTPIRLYQTLVSHALPFLEGL
jgi:hypothetical protein